MIRAAFATLGKLILLLAGLAFVAAMGIFVFGSFVLTWPVLRLSPRDQRIRATMNLASSVMALFTVLGQAKATKTLADALAMATDEGVMDESESKIGNVTEWPEEGLTGTMRVISPEDEK